MFMSDRKNRVDTVLDNHIHVWSAIPAFAPLARVLKDDRNILEAQLPSLTEQGLAKGGDGRDAARLFLLRYALERSASGIQPEHFTIFREEETVRVILEDSYGVSPGAEFDDITIPHQSEALRILVRCLFRKAKPAADTRDVICYLHLFSGRKADAHPDQDRTMRFRSMVWYIYLAIDIVLSEHLVCLKGVEYFKNKFRDLLDRTIDGTIINEESRMPGYEDGKWERTLFGWLQGEDRKGFLQKLKRQFNLENRTEHANRCLLSDHRRCVLMQIMTLFCK
jgi:hypothetical protein